MAFKPQRLNAAQAEGKRCTFDDNHSERPAVAVQVVSETGEIFYVCDECARDLGLYDE